MLICYSCFCLLSVCVLFVKFWVHFCMFGDYRFHMHSYLLRTIKRLCLLRLFNWSGINLCLSILFLFFGPILCISFWHITLLVEPTVFYVLITSPFLSTLLKTTALHVHYSDKQVVPTECLFKCQKSQGPMQMKPTVCFRQRVFVTEFLLC